MISDEMGELLSAYVDDELRTSDAARVEELAKRDPELRRGISAFRQLRKELRAWDASEQDGAPSRAVRQKAMQRARAHVRSMQRPTGRVLELFTRPAAIAAAALVAVALGLLAAPGADGRGVRVKTATGGEGLSIANLSDAEAWTPPAAPRAVGSSDDVGIAARAAGPVERLAREPIVARLDPNMSPVAKKLREQWEAEMAVVEAHKAQIRAQGETTSTVARNHALAALIMDFLPSDTPMASLVTLSQERSYNLGGLAAVRPGELSFVDNFKDTERVLVRNESDRPRLLLLGDVLGSSDKNPRMRIVASDFWLEPNSERFVPVVWGDSVAPSREKRAPLALKGSMPSAALRREMTGRIGRNDEFAKTIMRSMAEQQGSNFQLKRARGKMLSALDRPSVTGFAVMDGDKLVGAELFGTHELMREFAERLLMGYLREGGAKLKIEPLSAKGKTEALATVRDVLKRLPDLAIRTHEDVPEGWPSGLRAMTLRDASSKKILGHGIANGGNLIHLTVFPRR